MNKEELESPTHILDTSVTEDNRSSTEYQNLRYKLFLWLLSYLVVLAPSIHAQEKNSTPEVNHEPVANLIVKLLQNVREGDAGMIDIEGSIGWALSIPVTATPEDFMVPVFGTQTITTTFEADDGASGFNYQVITPITNTVSVDNFSVAYEAAETNDGIKKTTIVSEIASGYSSDRGLYATAVAGVTRYSFGQYTLQVSGQGSGGFEFFETTSASPSGELKLVDGDSLFENTTVTGKADRSHTIDTASTETTELSELFIELGKAYPATVLNNQVTVSFTEVKVVDGEVTGTLVDHSTGTVRSFVGVDVNQDAVLSPDEIRFGLTQYGMNVFLPAVQR